jgi:transcriptional regulator GlxA family with amidase domain
VDETRERIWDGTIKPADAHPATVRTGILVYDGVEELDVVGVYEVLAKAKQIHPQLDLTVRFRALKEEITGALGMKFLAHEVRRDLSDLDLLIVPGGPGRAEVIKDPETLQSLLEFGTEKPIASVCTGALILVAAGLLAGRKATTHRSAMDELRAVADAVDARVVEDGLVTTAGGVTASIDLGLHLLEKHFGSELAREVEERIEYGIHQNP